VGSYVESQRFPFAFELFSVEDFPDYPFFGGLESVHRDQLYEKNFRGQTKLSYSTMCQVGLLAPSTNLQAMTFKLKGLNSCLQDRRENA
jgi:hypothetical protein